MAIGGPLFQTTIIPPLHQFYMFINISITSSVQVPVDSPMLPADGMSSQIPGLSHSTYCSMFTEGYSSRSSTVEPMGPSKASPSASTPPVATTHMKHSQVKPSLFAKYKQSSRKHSAKVSSHQFIVHLV